MWICNFCASGNLVVESLHLHWERGMKGCEVCKKYKSCMNVDEGDRRHWQTTYFRKAIPFLKKGKTNEG